jgi:hypothetical protein
MMAERAIESSNKGISDKGGNGTQTNQDWSNALPV